MTIEFYLLDFDYTLNVLLKGVLFHGGAIYLHKYKVVY